MKGLVKKVRTAVAEKKVDDAKTSLREATSALSKAVTKGVIHPNTAARKKSALARRVSARA